MEPEPNAEEPSQKVGRFEEPSKQEGKAQMKGRASKRINGWQCNGQDRCREGSKVPKAIKRERFSRTAP